LILVDTSVWVDHFRSRDAGLVELLVNEDALGHPFVVGELALGGLRQRDLVLTAMSDLPMAQVATHAEVLGFIDRHGLAGLGIGYVEAHLLAAVRLTAGASLWTRDKRLHAIAVRLSAATGG
jgi:predicted nucleic acid-binding protein